jgi:BirA family transcriptional regulator, biotin operon repressor / biotin---[acetyl-CoA-carboxylase] ligase
MKEKTFVKITEEFSKNLSVDSVKKLFVFEMLDSTNRAAKDLAYAGAAEGTIVIAHTQKEGRGRLDRKWQSPEGGVYLSVILRPQAPPKKASLLPFVAALAVAKTIDVYGVHATVKWPNDVQVNRKKIAGILLESEINGNTIHYVVVGIGMNLNIDLKRLSPDIRPKSTSLNYEVGHPIDYHEFLRTFFIQFEDFYTFFKKCQYEKIIDEWKKNSDTLGKAIRIQTSIETIQGIAFDIDQSGFLLVRTEKEGIKKILSGDCLYFDGENHI